MEGNLSSGNINLGGTTYGGLDLRSPIQPRHHQNQLSLNQQHQPLFRQGSMYHDLSIGGKGKSSTSEEDEPSFTEDYNNTNNNNNNNNTIDDGNKGKKGMQWHRVKWADKMVKLLITAVSYVGDDGTSENGNSLKRRHVNLQKKGKWKSISKVMAERGHLVSPQQCEDKFNDLNKRYKRLNEILGRGTSCQVVERPELLEMMPNLSDKAKDEVKKILSSKQLFYEEMCSYHNKNRLHLPHDPELQRSLRLALRTREDHEHDDVDDEMEDHDEFEENNAKKARPCLGHGGFSLGNSLSLPDVNKNYVQGGDMSKGFPEGVKDGVVENQWMKQRSVQLEEQKVQIQEQMLELEREKFKWERLCRKEDRELEMMRVENEKMKLENEHMALELKKQEMGIDKN